MPLIIVLIFTFKCLKIPKQLFSPSHHRYTLSIDMKPLTIHSIKILLTNRHQMVNHVRVKIRKIYPKPFLQIIEACEIFQASKKTCDYQSKSHNQSFLTSNYYYDYCI